MADKKKSMRIECAWCKKLIGFKDGQGKTETSHGICPKCYAKEMAEIGLYKKGDKICQN